MSASTPPATQLGRPAAPRAASPNTQRAVGSNIVFLALVSRTISAYECAIDEIKKSADIVLEWTNDEDAVAKFIAQDLNINPLNI